MAGNIGKAYVQIVPSAKGIKGSISKTLNGEAGGAGKAAGSSIAGSIKGAIIASGIGLVIKKSITEGAKLEQSLGGIETLYGKAADTVKKNAADAWKTAGLSANDYMEQSTTFAASLLQSLGGDTAAAAKYADMAIIDMSDNANKMGTNIEDIQNAYKGFAKQNYTMLDNLKLGYGGTKGEMQRLLSDAEALSGKKYDISNLNDVYDAIHVVQEDLGITGTTSKEAATTLSGSLASMGSAATNFLGNLAIGGDIQGSLLALFESAGTFLIDNLAPTIGRIMAAIPGIILTGVPKLIQSVSGVLNNITAYIEANSGQIMQTALNTLIDIAKMLGENVPVITTAVVKLMVAIGKMIIQNLPQILKAGLEIGKYLLKGIVGNFKAVLSGVKEHLINLYSGIGTHIANLFSNIGSSLKQAAANAMTNFIVGLAQKYQGVKNTANNIKNAVVNTLRNAKTAVKTAAVNIGTNIITGIAGKIAAIRAKFNQIKTAITTPLTNAKNKIREIINKIKSFFNITLKFNGIKLPHISVSWDTSGLLGKAAKLLNAPGIPKLNVNWYKTGGIFDQASVIGVGEAGSEAVVPLDTFWNKMDNIANAVNNTSPNSQEGGNMTLIFEVDGEVFAKNTIEYINGQTVRYGMSPIKV